MATFTPKQVAGKHYPLFETYYLSLDPSGKGQVGAMDAAKFLKRSGLSDAILSKIWDLSDPNGKGYLDKQGVYVGLKLIAFAQNGRDVSLGAILDENIPEPEMSSGRGPPLVANSVPRVEPNRLIQPTPPPPGTDWSLKETDMQRFRQLYNSLGPEAGKIPGGKAKSILIDSKLPVEILGKIWDLADADKDGSLSEMEFVVAMQLVQKSLEKAPLPPLLPPELQQLVQIQSRSPIPASLPRKPSLSSDQLQQFQPLVSTTLIPQSVSASSSISSSPIPIAAPIAAATVTKDNWVVPYDERAKFKALFHLTDLDHDGYVSGGEIKGVFLQSGLPQQTLAHIWNLCDFDQSGKLDGDQFSLAMWLVSNALRGISPPAALAPEMYPPGVTPPQPPQEPELSPEFEALMKEINELTHEKMSLEMEISSKECDKKIKSGETRSLQAELDTLSATLKQLENQKNVAHGKLSELDGQVSALRFQAEEQEVKLSAQEGELSTKTNELDALDKEELDLQNQLTICGRDIEKLGILLQETLLQISQSNTRLTGLKEVEDTMKTSVTKYTSAIESTNAYTVTEPELRDVKPEFDELIGVSMSHSFNGDSNSDFGRTTNGFPQNFDSMTNSTSNAPWDSHDPFAPVKSDSFSRNPDPFAPAFGSASSGNTGFSNDPFGSVPFEAEVAPALPPKKAPPRPAPPKNAPARPPPPKATPSPKPQDPFSQGDHFDEGGFADFSQFDNQTWISSFNNSRSSSTNQDDKNNNYGTTTPATSTLVQQHRLEFTEDPFKNYRYEDPFENSDPFA